MTNENEIIDVTNLPTSQKEASGLVEIDSMDVIIQQALVADKAVEALKKVMNAALKITSSYDWVLIGGKPYLQESGAAKIANLFGLSQDIIGVETQTDNLGYKTFIVKVKLSDAKRSIVAEGSRSMKEDFFAKVKGKEELKAPELIDEGDVRRAAITNAINTGIKRMIPGLRGITTKELEDAGFDIKNISGYTFKDGSQGGAKKNVAEGTGLKCESCGKEVTQKIASYSQSKFDGHIFCFDCQTKKKNATSVLNKTEEKKEPSNLIDDGMDDLPI